jgi:hypothetical protein
MTKLNENNLFFFGEPPLLFILSIIISLITIGLPWAALFMTFGWFIKLLLLFILFFGLKYLIKKPTTLNVEFQDEIIIVKNLLRKKEYFRYDDISHFYYNIEGFLSFTVVIAKLKPEKGKKFYFFVPESSKKKLKDFLFSKEIKIKDEVSK